ncbi:MAG TPA: hypothetical protein VFU47_07565 [Armatimonadota bacterium]|nr:hypothetical protein [Armatimonadota bacterium]
MPDTRKEPLISVRLYDEAQGDPVVTDHGYAWYDVLQQSFPFGSVSLSGGEPTLERLEGIGLVHRPKLNLQDTRKSQFTFHSAGDWEEEQPETGIRKYRLFQTNSTANLQWFAKSTYTLPANPHCAFSFVFSDTPGDHDSTTYPPYVRIELGESGGQAQWGIEFSKSQGARLVRWLLGAWQPVMDLEQPQAAANGDLSEVLVLLRCYRGQVGISTDAGRHYRWFAAPDGSAVSIASSAFTVRGQGGILVFGLHQLQYVAGTFTSSTRNTFTSRPGAIPVLTARYDAPGGSVAIADASTPASGLARYQATLTPRAIAGTPFTFYDGPSLYSVTFRYPVVTTGATGAYTTPWDGRICSARITKGRAMADGGATLEVHWPAGEAFDEKLRWRKVRILLGWRYEDSSEQWWTAFTGYIRRPLLKSGGYGETLLVLELENLAVRLRRPEWTPLDVLPLGGVALGTAADYILYTEGMDASYRAWHALATLPLSAGYPEEPFELIRPQERKWETLVRLFGYAGLEVGVTDSGAFFSLPYNYVSAVTHTKQVRQGDRTEGLLRLDSGIDYGESATAALVYGTAVNGAALLGWGVDEWAESPLQIAAGRFAPWREVVQEEIRDRCDPGMLAARVQALATEYFPLQQVPDVEMFVDLDVGRRDRMILQGGAEWGLPDGTECVVLTLEHRYHVNRDTGEYDLTTRAGLLRIS